MYKFAIIDNHKYDIDRIKEKLERFFTKNLHIDICCDSFIESDKFSFLEYYDAIFLDIEMPKLSGFELAKSINSLYCPKVIFMTNYDHYMISTFDYKPFHFIQKNNFEKSSEHVLKLLLHNLSTHFISVLKENTRYEVNTNMINYIDILDGIITIHTYNNKQYTTWESLLSLNKKLPDDLFVPISQSITVNLTYIKSITCDYSKIILKSNIEFHVSSRRRNILKNKYKENLL